MDKMAVHQRILKWLLFGGAAYFFLVSIAHMFNIKIPVLFVYFNVPSYPYQDKIISFLAFGWAIFLYSGFESTAKNIIEPVKYILFAGSAAIAGLCVVNLTTDFGSYSNNVNPLVFWIQILLLSGYLILLTVLYYVSCRFRNESNL